MIDSLLQSKWCGPKVAACASLVTVSTLVGVLYKMSQASGGGFKYSTTSAITISEFVKFWLSFGFHVMDTTPVAGSSRFATAVEKAREQLPQWAVMQIWVLSLLYTLNNQLSFFVYTIADPGTVFLFKSASTMIVAVIQIIFAGKSFSLEQWRAMGLQACGMIVVQYDPCKNKPMYPILAYVCMVISATVTAICAARNEHLVQKITISLHVQNMTLYAGGVWMNLIAFMILPNPNSSQASLGFFDGYDNPLAIGVVFANSIIGIVITAVYKYADAVTKCIASDCTAVLLCIISTIFFRLPSSITLWCGVAVVCCAVHLYTHAAKPGGPPKSDSPPAQEPTPKADAAAKAEEPMTETVKADTTRLIGISGVGITLLISILSASAVVLPDPPPISVTAAAVTESANPLQAVSCVKSLLDGLQVSQLDAASVQACVAKGT